MNGIELLFIGLGIGLIIGVTIVEKAADALYRAQLSLISAQRTRIKFLERRLEEQEPGEEWKLKFAPGPLHISDEEEHNKPRWHAE